MASSAAKSVKKTEKKTTEKSAEKNPRLEPGWYIAGLSKHCPSAIHGLTLAAIPFQRRTVKKTPSPSPEDIQPEYPQDGATVYLEAEQIERLKETFKHCVLRVLGKNGGRSKKMDTRGFGMNRKNKYRPAKTDFPIARMIYLKPTSEPAPVVIEHESYDGYKGDESEE